MSEDSLDVLADRLRRASRVTILTGAGVSAASGVPTFRGSGGLWRQFRAEDLATSAVNWLIFTEVEAVPPIVRFEDQLPT